MNRTFVGHLVVRQMAEAVGDDLSSRDRPSPGSSHDHRLHRLAGTRVRRADDHGLFHTRRTDLQDLLDLGGNDVESRNDDRGPSAGRRRATRPCVVEYPDVPRVQPPVGVEDLRPSPPGRASSP